MILIDRDEILKKATGFMQWGVISKKFTAAVTVEDILKAPIITPASLQPIGAWVWERHGRGDTYPVCARCGAEPRKLANGSLPQYCDNCGAWNG